MAYGLIHFFPGGTQSQYDKTVVEVHPAGGGLPEGQTFHAAGASEGGWTIMAVHNSKDSWQKFRDGTLVPRMQQGIESGFETHLKKQDSRFTTCFPEPDLSGFSGASRVGDVAVDNEIIDTGDGGRLLAVDHHNFIGLVMRPGGPDPKTTAVKAMIRIIDARSSFR